MTSWALGPSLERSRGEREKRQTCHPVESLGPWVRAPWGCAVPVQRWLRGPWRIMSTQLAQTVSAAVRSRVPLVVALSTHPRAQLSSWHSSAIVKFFQLNRQSDDKALYIYMPKCPQTTSPGVLMVSYLPPGASARCWSSPGAARTRSP